MNYTFFAVSMYIMMRGLQVLFEDQQDKKWVKYFIRAVTVFMLYAAFASLVVWYTANEVHFLGFDPTN